MLPHVASALDIGQGVLPVGGGGLDEKGTDGVVLRKNRSDVGHTPGPAEVQAVQVDDLGVMAVGDGSGGEESWCSLLGDLREEAVKPAVR